jgi:outer membrane protein
MHSNIRTAWLIAAVLATAQAPAWAQTQTLKAGAIRYESHSRSNGISGAGLPPGADADVSAAHTVLFTYEIEVKPNVGIELVLGVPPKIRAKATGSVAFLGEVLSARNVAPTLFVNYHFGAEGDKLRPYVGLGLNYTRFTEVRSPYGWDAKLRDSVGFVGQVGLNLALARNCGLFGSLARVDVKSRLVASGATVLQTDIDFRPVTYTIGGYYRF